MNVKLPARTWVDLYNATGITIGTQVSLINLTSNDLRLSDAAAEPTVSDDHIPLAYRSGSALNSTGDLGLWALCAAGGGINVREVTP